MNCLAAGGRYIEIAMTALKSAKSIDLSVMSNNQTFYSVDLRKLSFEDPAKLQTYRKEILHLVDRKIIYPTICQVLPLDRIKEAYRSLEDRKNIGKIVVRIPEAYRYEERIIPFGSVEVKSELVKSASRQQDSIAIIGMSGRFAKSKNADELWKHLANGHDLINEVSRWNLWDLNSGSSQEEKAACSHGSFLDDIDQFDPLFFNISGLEATYMDPQQRFFLEESWKALEDAGYAGLGVEGRQCGIYVGCSAGDYQQLFEDEPPAQAFWGNAGSVIPARIAYYLNLQCPAVAIDTACSSSLVAIHLACQGLWAKEIEMALAGGVFLQSTPGFYVSANRAGMLSPSGRCHTFDQRADGFVPGEGVGVAVVKRLQEAIADGDHIYGVIRGSGINQDGATNGLTAPSALSQERLERHVYDTFTINPEHIQMVEAHGTGTILGDPIEYRALTRAFRNYTNKKGYCAIGSIKTNLGHTATAAGVAGLIKILLSLQHKQIPPSLNYQSGNSSIQFTESPFYVNTSLKDWEVGPNCKRSAALSSFGFSGTNAHMVIEEAPWIERKHSNKPGCLIVLSARTKEQLRQQVEQLVAYCDHESQVDCGNLSYTLLTGRKHFNYRLACVVRSNQELVKLLKEWLEKDKVSQIYISDLHENNHRQQASLKRFGNQCIRNCQVSNQASEYLEHLSTIAELYSQGYTLEFGHLFFKEEHSRISLPTYPFAKERYWISDTKVNGSRFSVHGSEDRGLRRNLHPLVHENTSNFEEQQFSSTFTGREFFFGDHQTGGQKFLPGVAHLEMVRVAFGQTVGSLAEDQTGIQLKNVVWARPLVTNGRALAVHIGLFPEENGNVQYEIYTDPEINEEESIIHSQGVATVNAVDKLPILDLAGLRTTMDQRHLSFKQCYDAFKRLGSNCGSRHQGIKELYIGQGQVLAKLSLSSSALETQDHYVLHPSLMDSALQASTALLSYLKTDSYSGYSLPLALQELEILGRCTSPMWVWIRYSDSNPPEDTVQKLDIDLCGDQGQICVQMKGFSYRGLDVEVRSAETGGTFMCHPIWKEKAVAKERNSPEYSQHLVLFCEMDPLTHTVGPTFSHVDRHNTSPQKLKFSDSGNMRGLEKSGLGENIPGRVWVRLQPKGKDLTTRYQDISQQVFETIRGILEKKPKDKILIQILVPSKGEEHVFSVLSALLKTAHLENPKILGQVIEIDSGETKEGLLQKIKENSQCPKDPHVRYQESARRQVLSWKEIPRDEWLVHVPWKESGVYLITGGVGGLGLIFAKEIASITKDSTLILTGRSPLSQLKQDLLNEFEVLGARIEYRQVDVSKHKAVDALIRSISKDFGRINGVLHSAGVIRDNFILKKTVKEFQKVLAPKVAGTVFLDQATQDLSLDFFILFSSGAGVVGNAGQADYSTANAYLDAYAKYRNTLVGFGQRRGWTLSINWPLWKEGGMQVDEATKKIMKEGMGMVPMETSSGIQALVRGLSSNQSQLMVLEGDLPTIKQRFLEGESQVESHPIKPSILQKDKNVLREKTLLQLKRLLGEVIKLPVGQIDANELLESYGIDSIMVTQLNQKLETIFGEISKTLFFEYQTVAALADYFIADYPEECMVWAGLEPPASSPSEAPLTAETWDRDLPVPTSVKPRNRDKGRFILQTANNRHQEPIAIIGFSGRYPQADTLDKYWEILKAGKDCITEIPQDRWTLDGFFHAEPLEAMAQGKSYSKWGSFIDGFANFDPLFFNISPREAMNMDPQERMFLQCSWEVLEDAGYTKEILTQEYNQRVGVFAGITKTGFDLYGPELWKQGVLLYPHTSFSSVANRISYLLNLQGPSIPIDTMCSSSLTAIHEAYEHIRHHDCVMAIAGGVNIYLHPSTYVGMCALQMLSRDGKCKSFGKAGNGFVPGEGVGVVLLKRLSRAIQDHDHIYAVIRGSSVNHGGKTNGYTVPNPKAQAQLIQESLEKAGVNARAISYVEAHGTGTELGDPIEITGLTQAFQKDTSDVGFCALGSAKSNLGHLEAAAGIAGLSKIILQMQHGQLVPSIHARELNPHINFDNTPFTVQQELAEWKRPVVVTKNGEQKEYPRIAGLSSFGAGGSNAHVVIEEYRDGKEVGSQKSKVGIGSRNKTEDLKSEISNLNSCFIVLSAKAEDRLREMAKNLYTYLTVNCGPKPENLRDLAYTLQIGREPMEERLAFLVRSAQELEDKLKGFIEGRNDIEDLYRGQVKRHKEALAVFATDEELQEAIDKWIQREKYSKLIDLWVKGVSFDWNKLYGKRQPRRLSLPTYPFVRKRYWIEEKVKDENQSLSRAANEVFERKANVFRLVTRIRG